MSHRRAYITLVTAAVVGTGLAWLLARSRPPVGNAAVPQPSKPVDLRRYLGVWYEIARYENGFERGLEGVTAEYRIRADGVIQVVNTGRLGSPTGRARLAEGRAKVVAGSGSAKLKVSFFGPFYIGDYWVLDRADDYAWSIVGEPSGRYLWLLSRTPYPLPDLRSAIRARAAELGYDTGLIRTTLQ
jgi:apolipoprotein D and lipocalin family protein